MTGAPTLAAYLDDGSGTFPYNVTQYVRLTAGITLSRGRSDEFDDVDAAQVALRLDNKDGRFSLGSATYGCIPDQRLKLIVTKGTGSRTYLGYVQSWPTQWDGPLGGLAFATITALDVETRLQRHKLGSMVSGETLTSGHFVIAYYPLSEPDGSTSAGDLSGNGWPPLTPTGSGTPVDFGGGTGPTWTEDTAALFAGGKYLTSPLNYPDPRNLWSMAAFFATTSASMGIVNLYGSETPTTGRVTLGINGSGKLQAECYSAATGVTLTAVSSASVNDGNVHLAGARFIASGALTTLELYLDGVLADSATASTVATSTVTGKTLDVGSAAGSFAAPFSGSISHVQVRLTTIDMAALNAAGTTGFAGETAAARLARIGTYAGVATSSTATTPMAGQRFTGTAVWDLMQEVAEAEGGLLYINQTGAVVLKSRTELWAKAEGTPAFTTPVTNVNDEDLTVVGDKTYLKNRVTGTRDGGAQQQYDNAASIAQYDVYDSDLGTLIVLTDAEVFDRCAWQANVYGQVSARMSSVTIDLFTRSTAVQQAVLGIELGDRMQITTMPAQSPVSTVDLIIEGWSETITEKSWTRTFNTAPAKLQQPFRLDDSTFGVLDGPYPIAY
jgi:hypothetical protein